MDKPTLGDDPNAAFRDFNQLMGILTDLDQRGLALTLAAFAEESLGTLLAAFLRSETAAAKELLEGFNAPLGTLSARIRAAYALGLVTEEQFGDLERLRKIRNAFSHSWKPMSFEAPSIAAHIRGLNFNLMDDEYPATLMERFRSTISSLLVELRVTANEIIKTQAPSEGDRKTSCDRKARHIR